MIRPEVRVAGDGGAAFASQASTSLNNAQVSRDAACAADEQVSLDTVAQHDLVFAERGGRRLMIDLDVPQNSPTPPSLLVWIHGGGFYTGDRKQLASQTPWIIAQCGMAVARIEYRLSGEAPFPAQIHDCMAAMRWLHRHADRLGYSTRRVLVGGNSAGSNLAGLIATGRHIPELAGDLEDEDPVDMRIAGALLFFGPMDFLLRAQTQPESDQPGHFISKLFGGTISERLELARLASPITHLSADAPPLFILHAREDEIVHCDQAEAMAAACRKLGVKVEAHIVSTGPGGWGHRAAALLGDPGRRRAVLDFIRRHGP